jgi:ParE toxin of type II toxin-antitoxin system, parDE
MLVIVKGTGMGSPVHEGGGTRGSRSTVFGNAHAAPASRCHSGPEDMADLDSGDRYRLRVGDHRVIYEIVDEQLIILIVGVGHRREAYRALS